MFPSEDEKARETPQQRDRRRARTGVDRGALNRAAITLSLVASVVLLIVAADVARLDRHWTTATVVSLVDRRHGRECVTDLATPAGVAKVYFRDRCSNAPWHVGDTAEVTVRRTRLTRTLVVGTRGTIFAAGYTMLPD